jgi:hypothetical protein
MAIDDEWVGAGRGRDESHQVRRRLLIVDRYSRRRLLHRSVLPLVEFPCTTGSAGIVSVNFGRRFPDCFGVGVHGGDGLAYRWPCTRCGAADDLVDRAP